MASNHGQSSTIHNCYNCGQPGHLSRFCSLPDRRFTFSAAPANPSTSIVPAQNVPLVTMPAIGNNVVGHGGYGYGYGGGLRPCVETLEATVAFLKAEKDVEAAREQAKKQEEKRVKKEQEEQKRRLQEKKEREEFHSQIHRQIGSKLDGVRELIEGKKGIEGEAMTKLRVEIEELRKAQKRAGGVLSSETEFGRYKRELKGERLRSERRFALMEEEIARLKKVNEEATNAADVWKAEALRPDNKRGSVMITSTPIRGARTRARVTPAPPGSVEELKLKERVEHQEHEIELLKEWRLRELNSRRLAEQEVERLREKMAKIDMENEPHRRLI
ncbi:hypothetical protein CBR_g10908 [Chara braunii]|uniref:CCHC-type domain-containing protein n=1 Tax=Chara braunii TaxID=69332 RepID=A0A388KPH6_CHABU|nr:hypothetical protein CBR_g10908 [Chara braunii]|eukprot:GBG71970.1 hypothetical protein CBR_g10908 [Chara braunii]